MRPLVARATRALVAGAIVLGIGGILTATNSLPATGIGQDDQAITADSLKPGACGGISLSTTVSGSGAFSGTGGGDLATGSAAADDITTLGGSDCAVGGGGDDAIDGGPGTDVCIGGAGADTFTGCETELQ